MDNNCIKESFHIPIREECDVLVVGGGAAGVMAALSAARNGAKTILVEQNTFLGGDMLCGGVDWKGFNKSNQSELIRYLLKMEGISDFYDDKYGTNKTFLHVQGERELFPIGFMEILRNYGVKLYLRCLAADVIVKDNCVQGVIIETKTGREAILASITVDCSGNADIAYKAGAEVNIDKERQSVGMAFGMANADLKKALYFFEERNILFSLGYDYPETDDEHIAVLGFYLEKMKEFLPYLDRYHLQRKPCITSNHSGYAGMINGVTMNIDTTDPKKITDAYMELNDCCLQMGRLFQEFIPGFENAYVDWTSPNLGIRFTRQVVCEYDIPWQNLEQNIIPPDSVGVIGIHDIYHDKEQYQSNGQYGIPFRALVPRGIDNLLVAGRMISSDREVFMSTSLIGSCFIQGEAAGTAAALASVQQCLVKQLDIAALQNVLRRDGVFVG